MHLDIIKYENGCADCRKEERENVSGNHRGCWGAGSYATLDFFGRLLECFPAERENERPRIIIDNNAPVPSRVRALLYGEHYEQVVEQLAGTVRYLLMGGADKIIFVCSTVHAFLPEILERVPEAEDKIVSLMTCTKKAMQNEHVTHAVVIGSEGTLDAGVYDKSFLGESEMKIYKPVPSEYPEMRKFIESVKQKKMTDSVFKEYMDFCNRLTDRHHTRNIILGCTEFPILVKEVEKHAQFLLEHSETYAQIRFWDPLDCVLEFLKTHLK